MTDDRTIHAPARSRRGRRLAAASVVALLALGACTSDPGARRVAEDIIRAETEDDPNSDRRDCMLDVLDEDFTDEMLEEIVSQLSTPATEAGEDGETAADEYRAALDACN